jgi:predicted metal-binding membrane protein
MQMLPTCFVSGALRQYRFLTAGMKCPAAIPLIQLKEQKGVGQSTKTTTILLRFRFLFGWAVAGVLAATAESRVMAVLPFFSFTYQTLIVGLKPYPQKAYLPVLTFLLPVCFFSGRTK